jgi:hypothetical protein
MQMNSVAAEVLGNREAGAPVRYALEQLLKRDAYLLQVDANERSITARLAMYLQEALPDWQVDCEYNRDGVDPKRLQHLDLYPDSEDTEAKTVFPDVIAHIRGTKRNYLVIELKKTTNTVPREVDLGKLRGYKRELTYVHALFIELSAGGVPDVHRVEWVDA